MPRTDRTAASNNVAGSSAGSGGATAPGSVTMVTETARVSTYAIRVVACEWVCAPFSTLVVMCAVRPSVRPSAT